MLNVNIFPSGEPSELWNRRHWLSLMCVITNRVIRAEIRLFWPEVCCRRAGEHEQQIFQKERENVIDLDAAWMQRSVQGRTMNYSSSPLASSSVSCPPIRGCPTPSRLYTDPDLQPLYFYYIYLKTAKDTMAHVIARRNWDAHFFSFSFFFLVTLQFVMTGDHGSRHTFTSICMMSGAVCSQVFKLVRCSIHTYPEWMDIRDELGVKEKKVYGKKMWTS